MSITSKQVGKDAKEVYSPEVAEESGSTEVQQLAAKETKADAKKRVKALTNTDKDKTLIKMERNNSSWSTEHGVHFTKEHPYQLVDDYDKAALLASGGFREANSQELVEFYSA